MRLAAQQNKAATLSGGLPNTNTPTLVPATNGESFHRGNKQGVVCLVLHAANRPAPVRRRRWEGAMRVAVLIIALCLAPIIGCQAFTGGVLGSIAGDASFHGLAGVGIIVTFLFIIGAAFAIGVPILSCIIFVLAALIGFGIGSSSIYEDMLIWGGAAAILAVMSLFGWRELRKKRRLSNVAKTAIGILLISILTNHVFANDIPTTCDKATAIIFMLSYNNSAAAKSQDIEIVDITNLETIKSSADELLCGADILTNDNLTTPSTFKVFKGSLGGLLYDVEPK